MYDISRKWLAMLAVPQPAKRSENPATTLRATGTVEPGEVVDVGRQQTGRIVSLGADPRGNSDPSYKDKFIDYGSPVEEGTILARFDDAIYKTRVDVAKASVIRAEAELAAAQAKAKSETTEAATASVAVAEAAVAEAKAALKKAEINLDRTIIRSPVKGVIIDRRVNVGQTVGPSSNAPSLFLIAKDIGKMQIWASVKEAAISHIHKGMEASFTVEGLPNEVFKGTVAEIRRDETRTQNVVTYTVVVEFENPGFKIKPYQTATVHFPIGPEAAADRPSPTPKPATLEPAHRVGP